MKKTLITLLIIFFIQTIALGCGAPQRVFGRATNGFYGISNASITLFDGAYYFSTQTNGFGYFAFENMTPCLSYEISIRHKEVQFIEPIRQFYLPGDIEGYEVNFISEN